MADARVILLEFNELSPALMQRFIAEGALPAFARLYRESHAFLTEAEERAPYLEPWIQWVNVHTGLRYAEHRVFNLNEGVKLDRPRVWDLLSEAGYRVWVCGSMNVRYETPLDGWVLPDPWSTAVPPHPAALQPYVRFVQRQVHEYTNDRVPLRAADYAAFARFMLRHGLSAGTIGAIGRQLAAERRGPVRWRRVALLDRLQFDLFAAVHARLRPHFATFFINSTAHLQHMYWRHMDPEPFRIRPSDAERAHYARAIRWGYQAMDRLVARFLRLAGRDTTLVFATALSQQPCTVWEEDGGKHAYRPREFTRLTALAGVAAPHTVSPVMSEQFWVRFASEADARAGRERLAELTLDGQPLLELRHEGGRDVFCSCVTNRDVPADAVVAHARSGRQVAFFELFYRIEGLKSGMHHPQGMLWIRPAGARQHVTHAEPVALERIAPTLLGMFGLPPAAHMRAAPVDLEAVAAAGGRGAA